MIDTAFLGFDEAHRLVFPIEYAVIEDAIWKVGRTIGVYNRLPPDVQALVGAGCTDVPAGRIHPYHKRLSPAEME
jgi:hypothetical protein